MNVRPHLSLRWKQQLMVSLFSLFLLFSVSPILPLLVSLVPPLTALITRGLQAASDGPWLHRCQAVPPLLGSRRARVGARTQALKATTS